MGSMASSNPWFVPFLALNATTAYLVNLFNFQVTKHTSALTLQVRLVHQGLDEHVQH